MGRPLSAQSQLLRLQERVVACTRCPRLIPYCRKISEEKRRAYRDWDYWAKPVPSFGDPEAEVLILGLAPAAHGANRTGRMFTGDGSGDFLYRALYEAGFASQPTSVRRDDGLELENCYITAALRCAPPKNKPRPEELRNCQPYLETELRLLKRVRAVLVLGRVAFDTYLRVVLRRSAGLPFDIAQGPEPAEGQPGTRRRGLQPGNTECRPEASAPAGPWGRRHDAWQKLPPRSSFRFGHGASYALPNGLPRLFASYHPSRQNTQTGKLTPAMLRRVLRKIRRYLGS